MACESGMGHTSDVILGNLKQEVVPYLVSDDRVASTGFSCFVLLRTGTTGCATMQNMLVLPSSPQYTPSRLVTILFAI